MRTSAKRTRNARQQVKLDTCAYGKAQLELRLSTALRTFAIRSARAACVEYV